MPRVKIVCPEGAEWTAGNGEVITGYGTQIWVDGVELQGVRSIEVGKIDLEAAMTVKVELQVSEGSEIDIPAHVSVDVVPLVENGVVTVDRTEADGTTRVTVASDAMLNRMREAGVPVKKVT